MKWTENNIKEEVTCSLTSSKYYRYKEAFIKWYKKQNTSEITNWKKQILSDDIVGYEKDTQVSEIINFEVDCLFEILQEHIAAISCYESYVLNEEEKQIANDIRFVENALLWPEFAFQFEEKCQLYQIAHFGTRIVSLTSRLQGLQRMQAPDCIVRDTQTKLWETIKTATNVANQTSLRLLDELWDKYDSFTPSKKLMKKYKKREQEVKQLHKYLFSLDNPKEDIYRHGIRLPGSGFSKQ